MVTASLELQEEGVKEESTMASASEINLAKERLALAKAQGETASTRLTKAKATMKRMMDTLTEDVDDAQKQFEKSQREIERAVACLESVENRREVINIDSDSDDEEGSIKKKIKQEVKDEDTDSEDNQVVKKEVKDEDTDNEDGMLNEDDSDKKPKAKRKAKKKLKKSEEKSSGSSSARLSKKQRRDIREYQIKGRKLRETESFKNHLDEIKSQFVSSREPLVVNEAKLVKQILAQDSVDDSLTREVLRQTLKLPSRSNYGM